MTSQSSSITSSTSSTTEPLSLSESNLNENNTSCNSIANNIQEAAVTMEQTAQVPQPPLIPIPTNELDLLIKLERANKEMETNHRSAQSILLSTNGSSNNVHHTNNSSPPSHSLSRRASLTSCEVNSLNNDDAKNFDEISWELWNQIIADWITWSKKKPTQLKEYIRKGIPIYLRPLAWQYLCGAHLTDAKDKYKEYLKKSSACEKIIRRDVDRTYPDTEFFRSSAGQESLFNVMKAYSIHDPEVGYCQGSAFICGLLLIQNVPEEEAFAIFVQIMQQYNLREIYKPNMYHLGLCMFQLDSLLQEYIPDLHRHFSSHSFHPSMYCSSWFLTLFTTSLPLTLVCRIFDIFLNEGFEIIFRIGLALLDFHKDNLLSLDMEGMLKYFQKELPPKHESDHDGILNKAFTIKYNTRKMKKLEKDFSILKKEEQEEQVEMRRLRAENKLLKQRIENLEKESAQLAERLIKGQVINAQNAESIYVLKNENQKLKDKINELQVECEQSNELRKKQISEHYINSNERDALNERVSMLIEENNKLREIPENSRLEEELLLVKMREAEAQLAIKELQKTIHVLNLEYQEFLNNRQAFILASATANISNNSNLTNGAISTTGGTNENSLKQVLSNNQLGTFQHLEEELLKVKLREAEAVSEMKSLNLKLMQLDTEKQVAYNQIKRQDEEIRKLNQQITQILDKEVDQKSQLVELKRQLDDKDAQLKELNMTHKLQEAEDAHLIAELRQRVASLEVNIQELETTGQLNNDTVMYQNLLATSTENLVMPSSPLDRHSSFKIISRQMRNSTTIPVSGNISGAGVGISSSISSGSSNGGMNNSVSLSSIPATIRPESINLSGDLNEKPIINRSCSIDSGGVKLSKHSTNQLMMSPKENGNQTIAEYLDSEINDALYESQKSTDSEVIRKINPPKLFDTISKDETNQKKENIDKISQVNDC